MQYRNLEVFVILGDTAGKVVFILHYGTILHKNFQLQSKKKKPNLNCKLLVIALIQYLSLDLCDIAFSRTNISISALK